MFRSHLDQHTQALAKDNYADTINNNGELFREHLSLWVVLVDKGYIGLAASARAIHPKKKAVSGALDRFDMDRNKEVSSDHVVVENFFGWVDSRLPVALMPLYLEDNATICHGTLQEHGS
ncbi:hypothetical protein H257_11110 [Aphanomyces astaci]|uniref:DDE Tnp4 domain-containing protein n=1 Tax=Aphanomyces astaci TaxID=112090 RepID=W4G391_APHAT|nr:hypothetical protein H257_11110 [Aphanomyces astaci]ETV74145.1 hypothetical protein H257_11110 [Aphanomyces astaci]|eukprot:XP_009836251.1 hypothetical protein H257_11110 [Aphanomyces astaci]